MPTTNPPLSVTKPTPDSFEGWLKEADAKSSAWAELQLKIHHSAEIKGYWDLLEEEKRDFERSQQQIKQDLDSAFAGLVNAFAERTKKETREHQQFIKEVVAARNKAIGQMMAEMGGSTAEELDDLMIAVETASSAAKDIKRCH